MASERKIEIARLRLAMNLILNAADRRSADGTIAVADDELLYWSIPPAQAFDMSSDPSGRFAGNIMDDYDFLSSIVGYEEEGIDAPVLMAEHLVGIMLLLVKNSDG